MDTGNSMQEHKDPELTAAIKVTGDLVSQALIHLEAQMPTAEGKATGDKVDTLVQRVGIINDELSFLNGILEKV